ncbi:MAG: Uma2 family endonuclease [Isosphaeraceae bacterium]|nr:Uma2 family endonuclease [Isosphaeraceae bacterium]
MTLATHVDIALDRPVPNGGLFRFDVERYLEMVRLGLVTKDDRVELLEGLVVTKMGKNPPHVVVTRRIFASLASAVPSGWFVAKEDPIRLTDSVPEPDCAVLRGTVEDYVARLAGPADVALVVEVADASLSRDRDVKQRAYAHDEIPIYWLANLVAGRFEVYSDPSGPAEAPGYRSCVFYGPGDELPVVIAGQEVARLAVKNLLS